MLISFLLFRDVVIKFLLFSMPNIVPMVLPLSILLASIMTFGDLSENYEFAAMKSAGVSLQRAMKSLVLFILILSVAAFAFAVMVHIPNVSMVTTPALVTVQTPVVDDV